MQKFPRSLIVRLQESASNIHKIRFFFGTRPEGHGLKDWFRVTEHPAVALKVNIIFCLVYSCMKVSRFFAKIVLAGPMSLTGYTRRYSLHCRSAKPVHAVTHERHFLFHIDCEGFGHW